MKLTMRTNNVFSRTGCLLCRDGADAGMEPVHGVLEPPRLLICFRCTRTATFERVHDALSGVARDLRDEAKKWDQLADQLAEEGVVMDVFQPDPQETCNDLLN